MKQRRKLTGLQSRNQEIDNMFLSLYTDKAKGILSEHRFMKLTAALEQEQESDIRTFIREIQAVHSY